MANIYKSNYTGEQIDNSVGLTQGNTATQGQVLTANGTGGASWQDASVGTEVVANPTSGATEELSKLQVGSNVYSIPKGTEVVANPTLSGSESDLTSLEVNGTKYKIPEGGGTQLYVHNIVIKGTYKLQNNSIEFTTSTSLIRITSSKSDSYTTNDYLELANIIGNTTSRYDTEPIGESCGIIVSGQGNHFRRTYAMFGTLRITLSVSAFNTSFNSITVENVSLTELTDTVVPL